MVGAGPGVEIGGIWRGRRNAALVAPSGECLRGEGLVLLIGAVVYTLAAAAGPIVRWRVQWTAALALQHH